MESDEAAGNDLAQCTQRFMAESYARKAPLAISLMAFSSHERTRDSNFTVREWSAFSTTCYRLGSRGHTEGKG